MRFLAAVDESELRFFRAGCRVIYDVVSDDLICKPKFRMTLYACVKMYFIYI